MTSKAHRALTLVEETGRIAVFAACSPRRRRRRRGPADARRDRPPRPRRRTRSPPHPSRRAHRRRDATERTADVLDWRRYTTPDATFTTPPVTDREWIAVIDDGARVDVVAVGGRDMVTGYLRAALAGNTRPEHAVGEVLRRVEVHYPVDAAATSSKPGGAVNTAPVAR